VIWYIVILLTTGQAGVAYDGATMRPLEFHTAAACDAKLQSGTRIGAPGVAFAFCARGRELTAAPPLAGQLVVPPFATPAAPVALPQAPEKK
jgi:hypothetical protein